ncbi:hypothetical protein DRN94_003435 [archaeon]|nr:hypothetical protein [archaeon]
MTSAQRKLVGTFLLLIGLCLLYYGFFHGEIHWLKELVRNTFEAASAGTYAPS